MIYRYRFYSEPAVVEKISKTQELDEIVSQKYLGLVQL